MNLFDVVKQMTLEEKALFITGAANMSTSAIERLNIPARNLADGPHGIRKASDFENCTSFPCLCSVGASWNKKNAQKMGEAIGLDCCENGIAMILGPGTNIKRNILCGRNFEYFAEDPVLSGELAASYINGVQSQGVATSLKHFAANNQETFRTTQSSEIDERTLREIYLKPFEIAVKKSNPASVMCSYNKVNSIWASENYYLLTTILKNEWKYEGFIVSDWCAVHDSARSLMAGLDLQMPKDGKIVEKITAAMNDGTITEERLNDAVLQILEFTEKYNPEKKPYYREQQHQVARELAADGMVLLKNERQTLPLCDGKYQKIAVIGEFAANPLCSGKGSAKVNFDEKYLDSPLAELKKRLGTTAIEYSEFFKKNEMFSCMPWTKLGEFRRHIGDADVVLIFAGSMESEDTEFFDRRDAKLNPEYELFIDAAVKAGKRVVVVLQNGSAMILGDWKDKVDAIVEMWLAGEGAGSAVADILCGIVNPSGKLPETFPTALRKDIDFPANEYLNEYKEKLLVGYRYYDLHPEEIAFPFGHGLSYTSFDYSNLKAECQNEDIVIDFDIQNTGDFDGSEVYQLYVSDKISTVSKPLKELKYFDKVFIKKGETIHISFALPKSELAYYNTMLHDWITETGVYSFIIGKSSRDLKLQKEIFVNGNNPYTVDSHKEAMMG